MYGFFKRQAIKYFYLTVHRGSEYNCPVCSHSFDRLLPDGLDLNVLKEKKVIGAGYVKNLICPCCHSCDRDRLLYIFIRKNNLVNKGMSLLHVAPEECLQKFLEKNVHDYFSADLDSPLARIKMDITDIKFPPDSFDFVQSYGRNL